MDKGLPVESITPWLPLVHEHGLFMPHCLLLIEKVWRYIQPLLYIQRTFISLQELENSQGTLFKEKLSRLTY